MAETVNRKRVIAVWILRVILGLAFLTIGIAKLTGTLHTVQTFEAFGWGQWLRYVTGLLDIIGALLVLAPKWGFYGALVLACTVGFAAILSLKHPADLLAALTLTSLAAIVAWLTRPTAAANQQK